MRPRLQEDDVSQYWDLVRRIERLENPAVEPIHYVGDAGDPLSPVFLNGWVHFDSGTTVPDDERPAGFYRDGERAYLTGIIKSGTVTAAAFLLPVGYRPLPATQPLVYPVASNGAFGLLFVSPTGVVLPQVGSNAYFSLDGVDFRHA